LYVTEIIIVINSLSW